MAAATAAAVDVCTLQGWAGGQYSRLLSVERWAVDVVVEHNFRVMEGLREWRASEQSGMWRLEGMFVCGGRLREKGMEGHVEGAGQA